MDVGRLNKRLTLRTNTPTTDDGGGLVDSFANTITVWGSLEPIRSFERMRAGGIDATATHMTRLRYNSRVTPDDQVTYDGRTFNIIGAPVNVDEANCVHEMTLEEVV